jgi:hypothetical protein
MWMLAFHSSRVCLDAISFNLLRLNDRSGAVNVYAEDGMTA